MPAVTESHAAAVQPKRAKLSWPLWVSRIGAALFVLLYFFVYPLCYCQNYYLSCPFFLFDLARCF
jgi:hypothetical protein